VLPVSWRDTEKSGSHHGIRMKSLQRQIDDVIRLRKRPLITFSPGAEVYVPKRRRADHRSVKCMPRSGTTPILVHVLTVLAA
jgi:hypothetical protein